MIKIGILGACGRMGQRIYALAQNDSDLKVSAMIERVGHPEIGKNLKDVIISNDLSMMKKADVVIDFTLADSIEDNIQSALLHNTKMVIGTTGLSESQIETIKKASKKIPIVFSSNMSVGVNLLFKLVKDLTERLGEKYSPRIVEAHHCHKKDAPSGTAKTIAQIIDSTRKETTKDIKSIRQGEIVGDHDVIFESPVDILTVSHHAKTRDIFAEGALVAAKFIYSQTSGLFSMQDVLGLK